MLYACVDYTTGGSSREDVDRAFDASVPAGAEDSHTADAHQTREGHYQKQSNLPSEATGRDEAQGVPGGTRQRSCMFMYKHVPLLIKLRNGY